MTLDTILLLLFNDILQRILTRYWSRLSDPPNHYSYYYCYFYFYDDYGAVSAVLGTYCKYQKNEKKNNMVCSWDE